MIRIEGYDMELLQIGKTPTMGYVEEFSEKTMLSGLIRRLYRGKRFVSTLSYAYLLQDERARIEELLALQRSRGYLVAEISTPNGDYSGEITIDLNSDQTRWSYSEVLKDYVWINWQLTIKGRRLL